MATDHFLDRRRSHDRRDDSESRRVFVNDAVAVPGFPKETRTGPAVEVPQKKFGFITNDTLVELLSPDRLNGGNVYDIYQRREDDFVEPEALQVIYQNACGQYITETFFVDKSLGHTGVGREPRLVVPISSVDAMHRAISVLSRKVDNLSQTLKTCRVHYYKELFYLRNGRHPESSQEVYWFDPKAYGDEYTKSLVEEELNKGGELQAKLDKAKQEIGRLRGLLCEAGTNENEVEDDVSKARRLLSPMPIEQLVYVIRRAVEHSNQREQKAAASLANYLREKGFIADRDPDGKQDAVEQNYDDEKEGQRVPSKRGGTADDYLAMKLREELDEATTYASRLEVLLNMGRIEIQDLREKLKNSSSQHLVIESMNRALETASLQKGGWEKEAKRFQKIALEKESRIQDQWREKHKLETENAKFFKKIEELERKAAKAAAKAEAAAVEAEAQRKKKALTKPTGFSAARVFAAVSAAKRLNPNKSDSPTKRQLADEEPPSPSSPVTPVPDDDAKDRELARTALDAALDQMRAEKRSRLDSSDPVEQVTKADPVEQEKEPKEDWKAKLAKIEDMKNAAREELDSINVMSPEESSSPVACSPADAVGAVPDLCPPPTPDDERSDLIHPQTESEEAVFERVPDWRLTMCPPPTPDDERSDLIAPQTESEEAVFERVRDRRLTIDTFFEAQTSEGTEVMIELPLVENENKEKISNQVSKTLPSKPESVLVLGSRTETTGQGVSLGTKDNEDVAKTDSATAAASKMLSTEASQSWSFSDGDIFDRIVSKESPHRRMNTPTDEFQKQVSPLVIVVSPLDGSDSGHESGSRQSSKTSARGGWLRTGTGGRKVSTPFRDKCTQTAIGFDDCAETWCVEELDDPARNALCAVKLSKQAVLAASKESPTAMLQATLAKWCSAFIRSLGWELNVAEPARLLLQNRISELSAVGAEPAGGRVMKAKAAATGQLRRPPASLKSSEGGISLVLGPPNAPPPPRRKEPTRAVVLNALRAAKKVSDGHKQSEYNGPTFGGGEVQMDGCMLSIDASVHKIFNSVFSALTEAHGRADFVERQQAAHGASQKLQETIRWVGSEKIIGSGDDISSVGSGDDDVIDQEIQAITISEATTLPDIIEGDLKKQSLRRPDEPGCRVGSPLPSRGNLSECYSLDASTREPSRLEHSLPRWSPCPSHVPDVSEMSFSMASGDLREHYEDSEVLEDVVVIKQRPHSVQDVLDTLRPRQPPSQLYRTQPDIPQRPSTCIGFSAGWRQENSEGGVSSRNAKTILQDGRRKPPAGFIVRGFVGNRPDRQDQRGNCVDPVLNLGPVVVPKRVVPFPRISMASESSCGSHSARHGFDSRGISSEFPLSSLTCERPSLASEF